MRIANGMEFVNDEAVIGKWENIGWTARGDAFTAENLHEKSGDFSLLYFLPEGEPYWIFEGWTRGVLLIHCGGDEPILTYRYALQELSGRQYLLLMLEDKTEVFVKADSRRYNKETLGNHDDIDLPFVPDAQLVGVWESVAFVAKPEDFVAEEGCSGLYLREIEAFPDGSLVQRYMDSEWHDKWTKGYILSLHRKTAARYQFRVIGGAEYLFAEWKMGNYIYGGMQPEYYVFRRGI